MQEEYLEILEKLKKSKIALSENIDSAKIFINNRNENLQLKRMNKNVNTPHTNSITYPILFNINIGFLQLNKSQNK